MKINIKYIFLIAVCILPEYLDTQIGFALSLLILAIFAIISIRNFPIPNIGPLLVILISGMVVGAIWGNNLHYYIRDIAFFSSPLIYFVMGYVCIRRKYIDLTMLLRAIIYGALIVSILHIFNVIMNINSISLNTMRTKFGTSSVVTLCAIVVLLFGKEYVSVPKKMKWSLLLLFMVSIILYLSRTAVIMLLLSAVIFAIKRNMKIDFGQVIKIIFVAGIICGISLWILPRDAVDWIVQKFVNISKETTVKGVVNWTYETATQYSRAYEKYSAIKMFKEASWLKQIFGFGFGMLFHLDIALRIGGEPLTELGTIHNTYYLVFFKTGVIGFVAMLYFFFGKLRRAFQMISQSEFIAKLEIVLICWVLVESLVVPTFFVMYSSFLVAYCMGALEGIYIDKIRSTGIDTNG